MIENNFPKNYLGPVIKEYRTKRRVSQEKCIELLRSYGVNINRSRLSRIENCRTCIWDYEVFAFFEALNIPRKELNRGVRKVKKILALRAR